MIWFSELCPSPALSPLVETGAPGRIPASILILPGSTPCHRVSMAVLLPWPCSRSLMSQSCASSLEGPSGRVLPITTVASIGFHVLTQQNWLLKLFFFFSLSGFIFSFPFLRIWMHYLPCLDIITWPHWHSLFDFSSFSPRLFSGHSQFTHPSGSSTFFPHHFPEINDLPQNQVSWARVGFFSFLVLFVAADPWMLAYLLFCPYPNFLLRNTLHLNSAASPSTCQYYPGRYFRVRSLLQSILYQYGSWNAQKLSTTCTVTSCLFRRHALTLSAEAQRGQVRRGAWHLRRAHHARAGNQVRRALLGHLVYLCVVSLLFPVW